MSALLLLTGASGFVGPHVVARLRADGYRLRIALRRPEAAPQGVEAVAIGDLSKPVDWTASLSGVDHVVHMAGLAHAGPGIDPAIYDAINRRATLDLAEGAVRAGVNRFINLSSVKAVTGDSDPAPLDDDTPCSPSDPYGRSKRAAEVGLAGLDLDWVSLRPVLIYGSGVKANMAMLTRLARLPIPLPLGALKAPRSLLAAENLADAIAFALSADCPARRSYLVADPTPVSVAEIMTALRAGLGRAPGLISVPATLLQATASLVGKKAAYGKLAGGLVARPDGLLRAGWRPPLATQAALARLGAASRAD